MIYLDNAATTQVRKEVQLAMLPYFKNKYGNPSSLYLLGKESRMVIENARKAIAKIINTDESEIIFTSGGTESDNLAIKGFALANKHKGNHIITSKIEHPAVYNTCKALEKEGFKVDYVNVNKEGIVDLNEIKKLINKNTILVSIMHANNEMGTIQPIEEIGKLCRENKITFHTDAVQTFCKLPIDVEKMNIDLLSASGHKIYGPKGVGFLYVRKGIKLSPLFHGGEQESKIRSGTENVQGIVGMAKAAELANREIKKETARLIKIRNKLIEELLKIPNTKLNGGKEKRLANNINVSFKNIEGESIILLLDKKGICASTGSACSSHSLEPSRVLLSLGLSHLDAHGSVRFTLGISTTEEDINKTVRETKSIVEKLRRMSPFE